MYSLCKISTLLSVPRVILIFEATKKPPIKKYKNFRRKTRYGDCNRGTAGFAYVGGACVVNKRLEKVNSVAIVEDTGGFSGIIVAAHELGHL